MLDDMHEGSSLVREARTRAGLSARELAEVAGVSASTVVRVERGQMNPTVSMLERLLNAAGTDLVIMSRPRAAVAPTVGAIRRYAPTIRKIASRHGGSNVRIVGSVARGKARHSSDVDLLMDVASGTGLFEIARMEDELADSLPWRVDVITSGAIRGRLSHLQAEAVPL